MKTDYELINSIIIDKDNFEEILRSGRISGTLYTEIKNIIKDVERRSISDTFSFMKDKLQFGCSRCGNNVFSISKEYVFCTKCGKAQ